MRKFEALEKVIQPIVNGYGCTWVGLQYFPQGRKTLLRLYIDKQPNGVSLEDCERVSRQVDAVLAVEDLIKGEYTLEVSSPGLDRLLFNVEQCQAYIGKEVAVRLGISLMGQRNFKGQLAGVEGDNLRVLVEGKEVVFSFIDIDEIRLVPQW